MQIKPSFATKAIMGISGHAGAGHVHSHGGFIQDDSGGFAVASSFINIAYPADTLIHRVSCTDNVVEVETVDGGIGTAIARRGFTRYEEELLQRSLGRNALYSQSIAYRCFGRVYGQGVMEAPVAFQTALCRAVIDTFHRKYPEEILVSDEGLEGNVGMCMAALIEVHGTCVAVMAVMHETDGGIGPVEDLEGNICLAAKGSLMKRLGLTEIPTIIIEGKAYIPTFSSKLTENTFWVRFNEDFDNPAVGDALIKAVDRCQVPGLNSNTAYPRYTGEMKDSTIALGRKIADIGNKIQNSTKSREKVSLIAELAILVSQDAGGITYMSNDLHEVVAAGGLVPGLTAVLSIAVSETYIKELQIPEITPDDIKSYVNISVEAIKIMAENIEQVSKYVGRKDNFDVKILGELVQT